MKINPSNIKMPPQKMMNSGVNTPKKKEFLQYLSCASKESENENKSVHSTDGLPVDGAVHYSFHTRNIEMMELDKGSICREIQTAILHHVNGISSTKIKKINISLCLAGDVKCMIYGSLNKNRIELCISTIPEIAGVLKKQIAELKNGITKKTKNINRIHLTIESKNSESKGYSK